MLIVLLLTLGALTPSAFAATSLVTQTAPAGAGQVVVTLTIECLRIPSVTVELRNVDGNVVIAQTTSDEVGQVTFPDVPAGRYVVQAVARRLRRRRVVAVRRCAAARPSRCCVEMR